MRGAALPLSVSALGGGARLGGKLERQGRGERRAGTWCATDYCQPSAHPFQHATAQGAVMFLCSEQTEGLQRLLMFLGGEHELLRAFLREHRRLMEHARLQGLQHVAAALRNHQKVLQETLATGGAQA